MDVIAGPQGGGKSDFFPVKDRGGDWFNIDDRKKALNQGSPQNIPEWIRLLAGAELEAFITQHIETGKSFSFEATLALGVTFEQVATAKGRYFFTQLTYVATEAEICRKRVGIRWADGGHGASDEVLARVYADSMANLPRAIRAFDVVEINDNSPEGARPRRVLEACLGAITYVGPDLPGWLLVALHGTRYDLG